MVNELTLSIGGGASKQKNKWNQKGTLIFKKIILNKDLLGLTR